ncbi:MAG: hypothetical protein IJ370_04940 [Oscillospiraceae bacterium]|nr:hypothetical protein [Oscillospiraceae bacterium]
MQENFRTQAFGFNKKDVIDYIYEITTQKENFEKEATEQIETLTADREKFSKESRELADKNAILESQIQALKAELADSNMQKSRLFEEINENRRLLLDNERELNIKNEQINKLIAENEDLAQKCDKYSEIARDVGKTIMEAKQMAADIVDRAKGEADKIRMTTEQAVFESLREISSANGEIENLKHNVADMTRICENRIKTVELNLKAVAEAVARVDKQAEPEVKAESAENAEDETENREFF